MLDVVDHIQLTPAIINFTKPGKNEQIQFTKVAITIGNTQYPNTHIL